MKLNIIMSVPDLKIVLFVVVVVLFLFFCRHLSLVKDKEDKVSEWAKKIQAPRRDFHHWK